MASTIINMYRDKRRGKLGGVCAGIAHKLGVEPWLVRIIAVTCLLFTSFLTLIFYIAAWLMLDDKPSLSEAASDHIKSTSWEAGLSSDEALTRLDQRLQGINSRISTLERLLTSEEFRLRREFNDLNK
ncbi:envelope stress response membrane protein PspC [Oceanisphaera avium]|uniref:Envelope stress response membrane protein PspC n=1 Tax=Oceanisphaera avium TaxID=1903694 RepID=A0A1Y0CVR8_9GAMM|nr:envelope stress response membrane protein PspC [Oceanisphaera avium]ART78975.1 envelope stress response membrane protein PspC [Oceanisphaera avium]